MNRLRIPSVVRVRSAELAEPAGDKALPALKSSRSSSSKQVVEEVKEVSATFLRNLRKCLAEKVVVEAKAEKCRPKVKTL